MWEKEVLTKFQKSYLNKQSVMYTEYFISKIPDQGKLN